MGSIPAAVEPPFWRAVWCGVLGIVISWAGASWALGQTADGPVTRPVGGLLPSDANPTTQTSNGAELLPQGQLVNVEQPPRSPLQFSASALYLYGNASGYVQAPRAGRVGTSNYQRPTFKEIGIKTVSMGDFELAAQSQQYGEFFVGAEVIQLGGGANLGQRLVTDAKTFPGRAHVDSDMSLNWYRLGYRYEIPISFAANGHPDLVFEPWIDVFAWNFDYHLTAARVSPASRSFAAVGLQIGAIFSWRPNGGPLAFEAALGGFPNISGLAEISTERLYAKYHFYQWNRFDFTGMLGVAFEQQLYNGNEQFLQNRDSANFGPMLLVGMQVQF